MIAALFPRKPGASSPGDYDYLNARVRAMSTELLAPEFYEHVLASFTEGLLRDSLLASPYAADVRRAIIDVGSSGLCRVIETAVARNTHAAFGKILAMAPPEPRRLVSLVINRWDVANVVALARALIAGAGPHESRAALLPIGELSEQQLIQLAAVADVDALADAVTSWKHGVASVMRRALIDCDEPDDPRAVERALYGAYFAWALAQLRPGDPHERAARDCIRMAVDLVNVGIVLAHVRDKTAPGGPASAGPEGIVERGIIPVAVLREISAAPALESAFESLMETYLAPGIEKGILSFGQAQSLAVMEGFLEEVVLARGCRLFRRDMLGVTVPLGFVWRKYCELANLRLLARGIAYGMPPDAVRQELVNA